MCSTDFCLFRLCSFTKHFEEHGEYEVIVNSDLAGLVCHTNVVQDPDNAYSRKYFQFDPCIFWY